MRASPITPTVFTGSKTQTTAIVYYKDLLFLFLLGWLCLHLSEFSNDPWLYYLEYESLAQVQEMVGAGLFHNKKLELDEKCDQVVLFNQPDSKKK